MRDLPVYILCPLHFRIRFRMIKRRRRRRIRKATRATRRRRRRRRRRKTSSGLNLKTAISYVVPYRKQIDLIDYEYVCTVSVFIHVVLCTCSKVLRLNGRNMFNFTLIFQSCQKMLNSSVPNLSKKCYAEQANDHYDSASQFCKR